jgi:hypothetical protein
MLRVTIELLHGGDESRKRLLATATIANVSGGEIADYDVHVISDDLEGVRHAVLKRYPRRASSVWDIVLRGICRTLTLHERLPKRPPPLSRIVPVRTPKTGIPYVRMMDIPEPARTAFAGNMARSTRPVIEEEADTLDCAYLWDFRDWLAGAR